MIYSISKGKLIFPFTLLFTLIIGVNISKAQVSLLKDMNPGSLNSMPDAAHAIKLNNIIYFTATDSAHGTELWRTDGSYTGTYLVKDIFPGSTNSGIGQLLSDSILLYFFAKIDSSNRYTLWKSDGTESGTIPIKSNLYSPRGAAFSNHQLIWICRDTTNYPQLWVSDGTSNGTFAILTNQIDSNLNSLGEIFTFNNKFYFTNFNNNLDIDNIWLSDGTTNGTKQVLFKNKKQPFIYASNFIVSNDKFFFIANDVNHGGELWLSDGTDTGTYMIKDINAGKLSSSIQPLSLVGGILYFTADDGKTGSELWRCDGTESGTILVKDIHPGTKGSNISPGLFKAINNQLYFSARIAFPHLWKSDGTENGTIQLTEKDCDTSGFGSAGYLELNSILYLFSGNNITYADEIWESNGTKEGTFMINDLSKVLPSNYLNYKYSFGTIGTSLLFAAQDSLHGIELWKYNTITGVHSNFTPIHFEIFPNPTAGKLIISTDSKMNHTEVTVYNIMGEPVLKTTSLSLDISNQPKGLYFVRVESELGTTTKKVVVE